MLEVRGLRIARGTHAWTHDFALRRGEMLAVLGPSGIGKSTLIECLGGFVPALAGEVRLDGFPLLSLPAEARPVATLFQQHNLFEHISVEDNLRLGFRQGRPSRETWQRVRGACDALGVAELLARRPAALSGGQRQRVALIRTMLRDCPLVLLDEPFAALDADSHQACGDWVRAETSRNGKMVLFVTHDEADAARWADDRLRLSAADRGG